MFLNVLPPFVIKIMQVLITTRHHFPLPETSKMVLSHIGEDAEKYSKWVGPFWRGSEQFRQEPFRWPQT